MAVDTAEAYLEVEAITRREARNFSYGIRLLRPPVRCPPSMPWPAGSMTSATASCPRSRSERPWRGRGAS
jgi:hypothetical protein